MQRHIVLSFIQARQLLEAKADNLSEVPVSLDLGISESLVTLTNEKINFPNGQTISWKEIEKISDDENKCFFVEGDQIHPITVFSETTNMVRNLYPTKGAPTTLVGGYLMHRVKNIDPLKDTAEKISALSPIYGLVLDTATGLGYSAISLAENGAKQVITIEKDPSALEVALYNPYSMRLFSHKKITQVIGDTTEEIKKFPDTHFNLIFHDPPTFSLGGQMYSQEFYNELFRVLKYKGKLFHYIGDLNSDYGRKTTPGIIKRLKLAGFKKIQPATLACGITAIK